MTSIGEPPAETAPVQNFGTAGIKPLNRPGLVTRAFMALVAFVERLNLKYSRVGNPPIYDNAVFPWTKAIEREWRAIRAELDRVLTRKDDLPGFHELSTDVAVISQDRGWKTFLLCGYGFKSDANIRLCPETWRICQNISGLITVMFSILEPGKHLPPHRGPYNGVLRLHLGLIVLLFVDFRKPLRFPANFLNWLLLSLAVFTPFIREGMHNQKAWEKKFYEEAEAWRNR